MTAPGEDVSLPGAEERAPSSRCSHHSLEQSQPSTLTASGWIGARGLGTCLSACNKQPPTRPPTTHAYYLTVPMGQESGHSLMGPVLRVSQAAVKVSAGLHPFWSPRSTASSCNLGGTQSSAVVGLKSRFATGRQSEGTLSSERPQKSAKPPGPLTHGSLLPRGHQDLSLTSRPTSTASPD